jgi:hypothetical protein
MNQIVSTFVLGLATAINAMAEPVTFPGSTSEVLSPSGQFALVWVEASASKPHQLALRLRNHELRPVMKFERHASVQWAPSGTLFAVTDAFASDHSRVLVYSVSETLGASSAQLKIPQSIDSLLKANHHSYLEAISWTQSGLHLVASGYGTERAKEFRKAIVCIQTASESLTCDESHER